MEGRNGPADWASRFRICRVGSNTSGQAGNGRGLVGVSVEMILPVKIDRWPE